MSAAADELSQRARRELASAEDLLNGLDNIEPPFDQRTVLEPLDQLMLILANLEGEAYLLTRVHPEADVRTTADTVMRQVVKLRTRHQQSRRIYTALGSIDRSHMDSLAIRATTFILADMRRAGVELNDLDCERVRQLRSELVDLAQSFARNIRDDVRHIQLTGPDELDGLPADYILTHPPDAEGQIHLTTRYPDYYPYMSYATSDRARMELLLEFYNRGAPSNVDVLARMLAKRDELAKLLGYRSWADYVTEDTMVQSAANANAFLEKTQNAARSGVHAELALMLECKRRKRPFAETIGLWESQYYLEQAKAELFSFDARTVRPYFEYRRVKQAIFDLNRELFGLEFSSVDEPGVWHPSVQTFDVTLAGESIGRISLDMHPRTAKYTHASCSHWRMGIAGRQKPHVVLICNFADPTEQSGPALLDHQEVLVFFHEFGHLVHRLAHGRSSPWVRLAYPSERDFTKAPSQLLEEWIFDYDVLRRFARHVETGEPIPEEVVHRLRSARDFGRALYAQWLLFRSKVSLLLHEGGFPQTADITSRVLDLAKQYLPYELPSATHFEASFEHLRNYTAMYYTYLWSQAIAKDLLKAFDHGLLDRAQARRYFHLVLAPGGTRPAADLITGFLGRPFSFEAYATWLG